MTLPPGTAETATTSVDVLLDANTHDFELREFSPIREAGPADGAMVRHSNTDSRRLSHSNERMSISREDRQTLVRLASQVSHQKPQGTLFEIGEDDAALDPGSGEFNLEKWLRHMIQGVKSEGIRMKSSGIVFKNLRVTGTGSALMLQETVGDLLMAPLRIGELLKGFKSEPKTVLANFNGLLKSGEMLLVLGRPGSGCSTFLKSLTGELHGLSMDPDSVIHYDGIPQRQMIKEFKGEVVYNQEVDKHFPHLTVGQTLEFAAAVRTPSRRLQSISRDEYSRKMTQVIMAVFGLSHTFNTKVGSDVVRGVSGGERKRVSIAEMALAGAPIAAWDNSTRGLDSATALKFAESLRLFSDLGRTSHAVAAYQASQAIYDLFDKVIVLYEGRQIYFGSTATAKRYFEQQGWYCPPRQTTGDFLTSITNPVERQAHPGMENLVPRTPDEFEARWNQSKEYRQLQQQISAHEEAHPMDGNVVTDFKEQKSEGHAKHAREGSPFLISFPMQVKLNVRRAYQRTWNDISSTLTGSIGQAIMALIIGSIFYGTPAATAGFSAKGAVLFFAVLLNALIAITEINSLYSQRAIVEKHASYAFYHPAAEAIAGVISDIPVKFVMAVAFNVVLYFLSGLRREPSQFFIFFLISYLIMFVMSAVFRTLAAITKTVSQAMTLAGVLALALIVYSGFLVPVPSMHPWFGWIHYINPIFYAFEILVANEFHGRDFECSGFTPNYNNLSGTSFVCSATGAIAGHRTVSGDDYIWKSFRYSYSHVWRNFGILIAFLIGLLAIYFMSTELNSSTTNTAEVLVFLRGREPAYIRDGRKASSGDEESGKPSVTRPATDDVHTNKELSTPREDPDIFNWKDVVYDIEIKGEPRRLLDHVAGWVKPGTLTALMGVSGAGKTTLLDVLAQRTSMGVVTGGMFVNNTPLSASFERNTGYVQQQDLHLETATVRESLRFSAMLRQPSTVPIEEKYQHVEEVIDLLNMHDFAEAIVGVPGEGLNVEQRKLLSIAVELAAKPKLLIFLDEPTSGLDSQSSWAICTMLRKLADSGQAILCTIHQPSAILFQEFDQLLFLARGGKTVYFGPIGKNSRTLLDYFETNGARKCEDVENPAEYMLDVVNAGTNDKGETWFDVWKAAPECAEVQSEIRRIHEQTKEKVIDDGEPDGTQEFAVPLSTQLWVVTYRVFQQYWRMPAYIIAKMMLGIASALFIGFSFYRSTNSLQGTQNIMFSLFMICAIFSSLVQQIMPLFVTQRALYEVRERPSKTYSWKAFILSNIVVEIPYQVMVGIFVFVCYYYPVNGASEPSSRQGLVLLFCIQFFVYAGTFATMVIAALPDAETAGALVTLLFAMSLIFNGVMQTPSALPGFWIFMYRLSPFTYWIGGMTSTQLHGREIECSSAEMSVFDPPSGQTCGQYLAEFLLTQVGKLQNPDAGSSCQYCSVSTADEYLSGSDIFWSERWRNFGLVWVYVVFDIVLAIGLYYTFRVMKWNPATFKRKNA